MAADAGPQIMSAGVAEPMPAVTPPEPTLAAVRLARAQRDLMVRRLRPAGLIMLAVVVLLAARKTPGPGLHGDSLFILFALAATAVGGVAALLLPQARTVLPGRALAAPAQVTVPGWALPVPFVLLVAGSAVLIWLQPGGPGDLGVGVAAVAAIRALPGRRGRVIAVTCVGVVTVAVILVATASRAHGRLDSSSLLAAVLPGTGYAVVLLTRRLDRDSYQIERLLIELEQAQDAEVKAAALAERQRLAREMHDVLAHSLSGLALQLEGARLLAADNPSDPRLADTIERANHLAKSGLEEARRAISMLRDEGLPGPERLAALVAGFERDSGVHCELTVEGDPRVLGPQARLTVYRAAQEALTNIRKHADAARAQVRLRYERDGIRLTVEDFGPQREPVPAAAVAVQPGSGNGSERTAGAGGNGAGGSGAARGYGLAGMRERAELLGGRLTTGRSAAGFGVELWIPS
jgi:signal transduction histidine kinase